MIRKKTQKRYAILIICILVAGLLMEAIPGLNFFVRAASSVGSNAMVTPVSLIEVPYNKPPTSRYAVGFMSYEIWKNSAGEWVSKRPGEPAEMSYTYNFSFPGRTVRDVQIRAFSPTSDGYVFTKSRGEDYRSYAQYVGSSSDPSIASNSKKGIGTSNISFTALIDGVLNAKNPVDAIEGEHDKFDPDVEAWRYLYPVVFEFQLDGFLEVHHFTTDGVNIDDLFTGQTDTNSRAMEVNKPYTAAPGTNSKYTYVGYKEQNETAPSGGSILEGKPSSFTYNGTYDTKYITFYYETGGAVDVKHLTTTGASLDPVPFKNHVDKLADGQSYTASIPNASGYQYVGYRKTTTGTEPSKSGPYTSGSFGTFTYNSGDFQRMHLHLVYEVVSDAQISIRHMVRAGPTGTYKMEREEIKPITSLPYSEQFNAHSQYGSVNGSSLSYIRYDDTVGTGDKINVSLSTTQKKAYVSFYYQHAQSFTGDFDVVPETIAYKDSFKLHPKDVQLNGCTYISHSFKIERSGTWTGPNVVGQTTDSTYSFSDYPWVIGVGYHSVYMKIKTSCGESNWIGPKGLNVTGPSKNGPPTFKIGFTRPNDTKTALHEVVAGTTLDLVYLEDPSVPTPNDPDGDLMSFMGFDFAAGSAFIQSIPSNSIEYVNGQHGIKMDVTGWHNVCGQMQDQWGLSATACTYINVVPPNPVPIIGCPAAVIENHPIPDSAFDASRSYSPLKISIDHTRDEWINKKTEGYYNGTSSNVTVTVGLHVYDANGLKSLEPAYCTITVKPDLPPVAKLGVPPVAIRGEVAEILNRSTSPDGDPITQAEYKYKYDANNNGFADDIWQSHTGTLVKTTFTPSKVGKYLFYVKVTEAYGKFDDTENEVASSLTMDVVNQAPEVSFSMEGKNPNPDLDGYTELTPAQMLNQSLYITNTNKPVYNKANLWEVQGKKLVGLEGRNFGPQDIKTYRISRTVYGGNGRTYDSYETLVMADNGYGPNRLSPWRSQVGNTHTFSYPLVDPATKQFFQFSGYDTYNGEGTLFSNKKYVYFSTYQSGRELDGTYTYETKIYALDPKKLSPVKTIIGGWGTFTREYTNGSPFVFVINKNEPSSKRMPFKDSSGRAIEVYMTPSYFTDWKLADGYIYAKRSWDGKYDGQSYWYSEIVVYDAFTGKQVRSSMDNPDFYAQLKKMLTDNGIPDGGGVGVLERATGTGIVVQNAISQAKPGQVFQYRFRINADLTFTFLSKQLAPAAKGEYAKNNMSSSDMQLRYGGYSPFFDAAGNMYQYEGYTPWSGSLRGVPDLNVTKYDATGKLVWRVYLTPLHPLHNNLPGPTLDATFMSVFYQSIESIPSLMLDPITGELYAKYYYDYYPSQGQVIPNAMTELKVINTATGGVIKTINDFSHADELSQHYDYTGGPNNRLGPKYFMDWSGKRWGGQSATVTIEGNRTNRANQPDGYDLGVQRGYNEIYDQGGNTIGRAGAPAGFSPQVFGEYVQDGVFASFSGAQCDGCYSPQDLVNLNISVGPPSTTPAIVKSFTNGQFYSSTSSTLKDFEARFAFNIRDIDYDQEWFGYSFRMSSPTQRYAVESDGRSLALAVYQSGIRTVLDSVPYPFQSQKDYVLKVRAAGEELEVFLNNTPILAANDATYAEGKFGYFSDKSYVTFGSIFYKTLDRSSPWSHAYAIWEEGAAKADIQYKDIVFADPENDPAAGGQYDWSVRHTARFIHHQGVSKLHGKTFANAQLAFDAVGDYAIQLRAKDDPNPDYLFPSTVFGSYRKSSNTFEQTITVHRRPIADFSVQQGEEGYIEWTDRSRDPDRYWSASDYSLENTGIDYRLNRGIVEKRFYYISPGGTYAAKKLTTPAETGIYEIGMAVKDEYGAWSEYDVEYISIGRLPAPDDPPIPGFTANPVETHRGAVVTFSSSASDKEDGGREHIAHAYYVSKLGAEENEALQSTSRTTWTKAFSTMGTFRIRQVVEDSAGQDAEMTSQVTIVNRPPTAQVTDPGSANASAPTVVKELRPRFIWTYGDPDADEQSQFQLRITRQDGGVIADTGVRSGVQQQFVPTADLPENILLSVNVRVFDGFDWSVWSSPKFFTIITNDPPEGDFGWTPSPVYEGDVVQLTHALTDPDDDRLTLSYRVTAPGGQLSTYSFETSPPYSTAGPSFKAVQPGNYTVVLSISDGQAPPVLVTKTIPVLPLGLSGAVRHTPEWDNRRRAYNLAKSGKENEPRGAHVFWAGEKFVLRAQTTATGTLTTADRVDVTLNGSTVRLTADNPARTAWSGELWESGFEDLADGPLAFVFRVQYSNGTVKTVSVPVQIAGNVNQTYGVHRKQ
ncbi:glycoside hydrolase family 78 protein [Paenibacillus xanthanilyticus]|uniref:PKD domain-containing protein n=1 Tax=Paenibacillus xanthanilyticus TaxID=1783531 RepID=A0ABV8K0L7_9BACL